VTAVPFIGFIVVALVAIAFVAVPLIRAQEKKNWALLLAAITIVTLGVGAGTYWLVGRPYLAQREARGLETKDPNGLIPFLIQRVRQYPNDGTAWRYLGQAYMAARDPRNAAKALGRAISVEGRGDAELDAAYGEALVMANNGAVPPEAEAAFQAAVTADAGNVPARFYLGQARLE
jgi:cytochrome c-type biogenesis protein CcmH